MEDIYSLSPSEKVKKLLELPTQIQRTKEWHEARKERITASEAASVLLMTDDICDPYIEEFNLNGTTKIHGKRSKVISKDSLDFEKNDRKYCNPYSSKKDFILKKRGEGKPFTGNIATRHGQKYEQVAQDIYRRLNGGVKIHEFGMIGHQEISFLGASPDGITETGKMLEIKCPYARIPTGVPPFHYWIQVQLQLQCCYKLDECDFIECVITEYNCEDSFMNDYDLQEEQEKGIIIEMKNKSNPDATWYIYPEYNMADPVELLEWSHAETKRQKAAITIQKFVKKADYSEWDANAKYWKLEKIKISTIKRSDKWFNSALKDFSKVWKELKESKPGEKVKKQKQLCLFF